MVGHELDEDLVTALTAQAQSRQLTFVVGEDVVTAPDLSIV